MKFTILLLFLGLMSHSQSDNINWNSENKVVYECKLLNGNSTISLSSYKSNIHNEIALIFKKSLQYAIVIKELI